jgi:hypothetical protein
MSANNLLDELVKKLKATLKMTEDNLIKSNDEIKCLQNK